MQHPNLSQSMLVWRKQLLDQNHTLPVSQEHPPKLGRAISQVFVMKKMKRILTANTIVIEVDVNGKEKTKKNTKSKATVIDEEDEEDELGMTTLTATGEATEYYL